MSRRIVWIGGLVVLAGLGSLVWAFVAPADSRPVDILFAQPNGVSLKLDLALPTEGVGPFPAVVCIHGGGWTGGSRKQMSQTIDVLARRGFVAVTIDYRVAPKHRFPCCIEDCKAAVRWLRANATKYRIDKKRIGAMGLSAGGHLACLLGVTDSTAGLEGTGGNPDESSTVQAVVSMAGPTDLASEAIWKEQVLKLNLIPLFGGSPKEKLDTYRKASPMSYKVSNPPPFLLVHGSDDPFVPVLQVKDFADRLENAGGKAKVIIYDGEGHTWAGDNLVRSIDQMLTFFDKTLKP